MLVGVKLDKSFFLNMLVTIPQSAIFYIIKYIFLNMIKGINPIKTLYFDGRNA